MYVAVIPNRSSPPAILLRESYSENGKTKKRTLKNLSDWPAHAASNSMPCCPVARRNADVIWHSR
jgi:hypothetical protein